jgi:tetratricopeptide (TPR) repeat protein
MPRIDELLNAGWQHQRAGDFPQAEHLYRQALAGNPTSAMAWCYLGMVCHDQERFDDALFAFQQSISFDPNLAAAYQNMGKALGRLRRFDESIAAFERAIQLHPGFINAYRNKAKAHYFKGELRAALEAHEQVLRLAPDDAETRMNVGMVLLSLGDTQRGWAEYEWRWKTKDGALPPLKQPLWDGSSLNGKSILLTPEQGLGDSIEFVRYGACLKKRYDCRVLFHCPRALVPLLSTCRGIDQLIDGREAAPLTDWFAPLLHVPAVLGHGPLDFPGDDVPYLKADDRLVQQWAEKLSSYCGKKVGIAWRGSPKHPGDRMRSIPLAQFAPLAKMEGVRLCSLQKGPGAEELKQVAWGKEVVDLGPQLDENTGAFVETAAVLKNLDLLVACDTAVIHVAGALAVPVWMAIGNVPDWRWMFDRDNSPAYPTLRLFRQAAFGDWNGVFKRLADALEAQ